MVRKGASALLHADTVAGRFRKKRNDLPNVPPHVDEEDIDQLEKAISHYFNRTEGRGRNCKVEPYRKVKTGKEYFFAYPEDYGQSGVEWKRDSLTTRSRHPAFEIIFIYCRDRGGAKSPTTWLLVKGYPNDFGSRVRVRYARVRTRSRLC